MIRRLCLTVLVLLIAAPSAHAVEPYSVVSGSANSKWFSGSLIQQTGLNCSTAILGESYTEVMVSGIASYGGLAAVPRVNEGYWTSLLLSIPGNPCGPGSSSVNTDVVLPPNTVYDNTRPIRCFGQSRNATTFEEITSQTWSFAGFSGNYCPGTAMTSALHPGALSFGFRPIVSGQLFQIFVPVRSSQPLIGASNSPADGFRWLTDATGVYENPGLSTVWTSVFAGGGGGTPSVFFSRERSAVPFWKTSAEAAPVDKRNRIELWANVYTAGLGGTLCYEIRRISDMSLRATCAISPFDQVIPAGYDTVQVVATGDEYRGPNGGYAPLWFDGPATFATEWDQDMRITWTFTPTGGSPVSKSIDFRTLAGPDSDGDGVADASDACPALKGTTTNGCLPAVRADDDRDGVYGASDVCPTADGKGALNGCPPAVVVVPTKLSGALKMRRNARVKRTLLVSTGAVVPISCTVNAKATSTLSISRAVAAKLKIRTTRPTVVVGTVTGNCTAAAGAKLKLKIVRQYKPAVTRARAVFFATLGLKLSNAAGSATAGKVIVKVF